jgi:hypothetical protein
MMKRTRLWIPTILLVSGLIAGCSDDGTEKDPDGGKVDGRVTDATGSLPDGYKQWPCTTAGQACNAHDPCAINPICGQDLLCRPTKLQKCDDGLDCTNDVCKGMGLCDNVPKAGSCALPVTTGASADGGVGGTTEIRCFKKGDKRTDDPCQVCDPDTDGTKWIGANGGTCDDGSDCTKDDYCQTGLCKGTYYGTQCADSYGCTEDLCDGKGGCLGNKLKSNSCLINGVCYKDGDKHPGGSCNICDTSKSQSAWTALSNTCLIGGKCYKPLEQDSTKCGECDPTKSATAWTPLPGLCKIDGACYKQGDKHTGGCAECDTAKSTTAWTVKGAFCLITNVCKKPKDADTTGCGECDPTKSTADWTAVTNKCLIGGTCYADKAKDTTGCLTCSYATAPKAWTPVTGAKTINEGFEGGATPTGWTITNSDTTVGWVVNKKRPSGGSYSLYYGDPVAGDYDSGAQNYGTVAMKAFTPVAAKKAGMTFMLYMDTESGTSYDALTVMANGTKVWESTSTNVSYSDMGTWIEISIDLSTYAGKALTISIKFDTMDDIANTSEGVYIDDITIYHSC